MDLLTLAMIAFLALDPNDGQSWPGFRGRGDSRTTARDLPLQWSEQKNLAWGVDLPGYGQSSPVVWLDKIFVTSVEGEFKDQLRVLCLDLATGKTKWRCDLAGTQKIQDSDMVSKGAPTPAVDAHRVYAFFESGDLVALDHAGTVVWRRSLTREYGEFASIHGLGSSIALTPNAVIVFVADDGPSYVLALDKATGKVLWKADRPAGMAWSSPTVITRGGQTEVLISSGGVVESLSAKDGSRLWIVEGIEDNTVPSPSVSDDADGLIVIGADARGSNLAFRPPEGTDQTPAKVEWRAEKATSSFASPLVHRGHAYFVNKAGVVFCVDAKTGVERWNTRLSDTCWASPVGAGDRVYFFAKNGTTLVLKAGAELEKLAENHLPTDDRVYGVAAVNGSFVIRTGQKLLRVTSR